MSKPKGRPTHAPENQLSREEQMANRAAAIKAIHDMLADGRATIGEMYQSVDGLRSTVAGYLRHMHKTLRTVRPTSLTRNRSTLWELGEDPNLPSRDEELDRIIAPKRGIRPAVQIGMRRDPLIAALFGPANQQEHKEAA